MAQEKLRFCRLCDIFDSIPGDISAYADRLYSLLDEKEKADSALMKQRIAVCDECDRNSAGTCLECGCYCIIRSMKQDNRCPVDKW